MADPIEVVRGLFEHLDNREWDSAAELFAPQFLESFASSSTRLRPHAQASVEDRLAREPQMPRAVAEYLVSQANRFPPVQLEDFFAGVSSEEELESMSGREMFARHLAARDPSTRFSKHLAALQARFPEHAERLEPMRGEPGRSWWNCPVVGAVLAEPLAHVLVSRVAPAPDADGPLLRPDVISLRRTALGWRVGHDLEIHRNMGFGPVQVPNDEGELISLTLW